MTGVRRTWSQLGGQLGLGCIGIGIILIGLGWNGAAGVDFAQGQIPYLLSGGALGLGLIITGATLIIVQNSRRDRVLIEAQLRELNQAVGRLANALGSYAGTLVKASTSPLRGSRMTAAPLNPDHLKPVSSAF